MILLYVNIFISKISIFDFPLGCLNTNTNAIIMKWK